MSEAAPPSLALLAHAKINLSLEILGRRSDGYHDVATILQSISLADRLFFTEDEDLTLDCDDASLEGEENLAMRAARLIRGESGIGRGARIALEKGIPVAAGLGGGSADAAATLVGLNRLWALGLDDSDLQRLGARLGSDVPFFIRGGTALATGRGDVLDTLPDVPTHYLVLVTPPGSQPDKTARLYRSLEAGDFTDGLTIRRLAAQLRAGIGLSEDLLVNGFDGAANRVFPDLIRYRDALERAGASASHLSGAGPTLFTLQASDLDAEAAARRLEAMGLTARMAWTLPNGWESLAIS